MVRFFVMLMALFILYMPAADASGFSERAAGMSEITGVRISASADKVRVVVDSTREVDYRTSVLKNPDRVVVDLTDAWLSPKVKRAIVPKGNPFVSKVRIAQNNKNTVRIVVETTMGKNPANYDVFSLTGGRAAYRVVMDFGNLRGTDSQNKIDFGNGDSKKHDTENKKPKKENTVSTSKSDKQQTATKPSERDGHVSEPPDDNNSGSADTSSRHPSEPPKYETSGGIQGRDITIDAGHGGNDSGAIGPTGVMEKNVTLRIATRLQSLLEADGATVHMTRTTDTEVSPKHENATDIEELQARCDVANASGSDIFVSIHMDSFTSEAAKGTTGYYYADGAPESQRLADSIRASVVASLGTDSRGTKTCRFYVVRHTNMPATLVEVAFISNPNEEKLLDSDDGLDKTAKAIEEGIKRYFAGNMD